jgi:hypothetical protein
MKKISWWFFYIHLWYYSKPIQIILTQDRPYQKDDRFLKAGGVFALSS